MLVKGDRQDDQCEERKTHKRPGSWSGSGSRTGRQEEDLVAFSIAGLNVALMFPRLSLSEQTGLAGFSPSHPVIYC